MTLSLVIPGLGPSATLAPALEAAAQDLATIGGELVVVCPPGERVPAPDGARVVEKACRDVLDARVAGIAAAGGDIVALGEDHTIVRPGWARRVVDAHVEHPHAAVIGGAVANGSSRTPWEWGHFLMTFGPYVPPVDAAERHRPPSIANLSLKRAALPVTGVGRGELEFGLLERFLAEGRAVFDEQIVVDHVCDAGPFQAIRMHFLNGRACTGTASAGMSFARRRRHMSVRHLATLFADARAAVGTKQLPPRARLALPFVLANSCAHVAGEWAGALLGPGRSVAALDSLH